MDRSDRSGARVRFPPPFLYAIAILGGALIDTFVLELDLQFGNTVRIALVVLTILTGVSLLMGAAGLFRRSGQHPAPWTNTPEIVTGGVYQVTRNPMYVGMALIQLGIGIGFSNGWIVTFVPLVIVLVYLIAVRHEEAYLEEKFGEGYLAYKRQVRRWI